jgi:hypothetical protein
LLGKGLVFFVERGKLVTLSKELAATTERVSDLESTASASEAQCQGMLWLNAHRPAYQWIKRASRGDETINTMENGSPTTTAMEKKAPTAPAPKKEKEKRTDVPIHGSGWRSTKEILSLVKFRKSDAGFA